MTEGPAFDSSPLQAEEAALVEVTRRAPRRHLLADSDVRAAVLHYAARARAAGLPPERLLVRIKTLVRRATADVGDWYRAVLTDRVVVWAIEGYYAAKGEPGA